MSNYAFLKKYVPIIQFMGEICGENYEIILHDTSTPERSVIATCNAHLSGRRVGDPITELAKELIASGSYRTSDYVTNYEGRTRNGKRFVSSTFFIKENQELRGLICVNHDVEDFYIISDHLNSLMKAFSVIQEGQDKAAYTENLDDSILSLSNNLIHSTVSSYPSLDHLAVNDKLEIIKSLDDQGVFSTKGAVGQVAQELHMSEPTVYRYLRRIRTPE